jgi:O-antigen/teichoic acid export membrane protein
MWTSRYKRLAKEGGWIIVGQLASLLGALVLVRVLTEYLAPSEFGNLALGMTVAGLVNQVVMGGVSNGILRYYTIAIEKDALPAYQNASFRLMGYASLVVLLISCLLIVSLLVLGYSKWIALSSAILVFSLFSGYNTALSSIQNAARQRAIVAFHGGLDAWLKILLALGMIFWLGRSSTAVVIGYVFSLFLVTASQFIFLRRLIPGRSVNCTDTATWLRQMWAFAGPFSIWGIFTWMQQSSDRWAMEAFTSTREVGLYAVLFQLGSYPITIATGLLVSFLAPIFFQRSGDATDLNRKANVHRFTWYITIICITISFVSFILGLSLHEWIFKLLVANEYREVSYLMPWMILAGGFFAGGQVLALKLMAELNTSAIIRVKIVTALLGVILNYLGASIAGIVGVTVSAVCFSLIYFLWMILLTNKLSDSS